jgi:hypothetical protein
MRKKSSAINGLAAFLGLVSVSWLVYDFIAYGILRSRMLAQEPLRPLDEKLGLLIWIGLAVFLIFHITSFIAIASQFHRYKKTDALRVIALIVGIISCVLILTDIACLSDIGNEYETGLEVENEWSTLYKTTVFHGIFFIVMLANLVTVLSRKQKALLEEPVLRDEIIFNLMHGVGVCCGAIGLLVTFASFLGRQSRPILEFAFPFVLLLTLIPYAVVASYWLIMKLREERVDWWDEKQIHDISRAGLITMLATIPFLAFFYLLNYGAPKGPIDILWFPAHFYFVLLVFSVGSLGFSWRE